jgi:hypothetical protein
MLRLIDKASDDGIWIEAWYDLPNGNCVVEKFTIRGEDTCARITTALELFGKQVLKATPSSLQMLFT